MKLKSSILLLIWISFFSYSYSVQRVENHSLKQIVDGVIYIKGEKSPFTGKLKGNGSEEEYKNGIRDGIFKGSLNIDGKSYLYEGEYVEGIKHGQWVIKYPDGTNKAILKYSYDKPDGKWAYFYENNKIEGMENFEDGILSGAVILYGKEGEILKKANYENGLLTGEVTFFYSANVLDTIAHFSYGRLNGEIKMFSNENIIQLEGSYKNDKRDALWKMYYKTGDLKVIVSYKNGLKNGRSVIYDKGGAAVQTSFYRNNDEIDSKGNVISVSKPFRDGIVERFRKFNSSLKYIKYNKILSEL